MDLYMLRHGAAVQREDWTDDEAIRPLIASGVEEIERVAQLFAKLGVAFDVILSSPLARAYQTAEIVADRLNLRDRLVREPVLSPDAFGPRRLPKLLRSHPEAMAVLMVGHEPSLGETISYLAGGRIILKKGGLALVRVARDSLDKGALEWLLQSNVMGL